MTWSWREIRNRTVIERNGYYFATSFHRVLAPEIVVCHRGGDGADQGKKGAFTPWLEFPEDTPLLLAELEKDFLHDIVDACRDCAPQPHARNARGYH